MGNERIIRAWKDADYRASLSEGELAMLPASPAGTIDLSDDDLGLAAGGDEFTQTGICCLSATATSLPCIGISVVVGSKGLSCLDCETTLWHGTCYASSIGCCKEAEA